MFDEYSYDEKKQMDSLQSYFPVPEPIRSWLFKTDFVTPAGSLDLSVLSVHTRAVRLPARDSKEVLVVTFNLVYEPDIDDILYMWKTTNPPCIVRVTLLRPDMNTYRVYEFHGVKIDYSNSITLDWASTESVTRVVGLSYDTLAIV